MTGKQRAELRKLSNGLTAIFQIGKDNITETLAISVGEALKKRELIKLSVLETSELSAKEAAEQLAQMTEAEVIQCIGRKFVLYKENKDK